MVAEILTGVNDEVSSMVRMKTSLGKGKSLLWTRTLF